MIRKERLQKLMAAKAKTSIPKTATPAIEESDYLSDELNPVELDKKDLDWSTVLKRTFEGYIRGERPNMYGEWIAW